MIYEHSPCSFVQFLFKPILKFPLCCCCCCVLEETLCVAAPDERQDAAWLHTRNPFQSSQKKIKEGTWLFTSLSLVAPHGGRGEEVLCDLFREAASWSVMKPDCRWTTNTLESCRAAGISAFLWILAPPPAATGTAVVTAARVDCQSGRSREGGCCCDWLVCCKAKVVEGQEIKEGAREKPANSVMIRTFSRDAHSSQTGCARNDFLAEKGPLRQTKPHQCILGKCRLLVELLEMT